MMRKKVRIYLEIDLHTRLILRCDVVRQRLFSQSTSSAISNSSSEIEIPLLVLLLSFFFNHILVLHSTFAVLKILVLKTFDDQSLV